MGASQGDIRVVALTRFLTGVGRSARPRSSSFRAVAQGFAKTARDAGEPLRAAGVIFRVRALAGLEETLADAYVDLWGADAGDVNDTVVALP